MLGMTRRPTWKIDGRLIAEKHGDDTFLGITKFYRVSFFKAIGEFVCELMSDGIPSLVSLTTRTLRSVEAIAWDAAHSVAWRGDPALVLK